MSAKRVQLAAWLRGDGIEIGALHRPLPVPPTARVVYVDRLPESELRQHYPELAAEAFAPVSVLGSAEDLSAFADGSLDFVIANHLLEHLQDPVKGLLEFDRVLRRDGVLYLALPDPRVSFDRERKLTSVEHLLEEHRHGPAENRRAHYLDWAARVDKADPPEARASELMTMDYSIHFHVWRPDTFLEFLFAAKRETTLDFELAAFAPPEHSQDDEFILVLLKGSSQSLRLPPPPPSPEESDGRWRRVRSRVAASPVGPLLRPGYHLVRRLSHKRATAAEP